MRHKSNNTLSLPIILKSFIVKSAWYRKGLELFFCIFPFSKLFGCSPCFNGYDSLPSLQPARLTPLLQEPSVPVECPPCLCMMAEDQADRANYVLTPWAGDNTTVATTTKMAASTTTTTTTSTTTTPTTTSTPTSSAPPPPVPCGGSQESDLCLSESCVMAAGTILNSMDRR